MKTAIVKLTNEQYKRLEQELLMKQVVDHLMPDVYVMDLIAIAVWRSCENNAEVDISGHDQNEATRLWLKRHDG